MSEQNDDFAQEVLANWPEDAEALPPSVRDAYLAWFDARYAILKAALTALSQDGDNEYVEPLTAPDRAEMARALTVYGWTPIPQGIPVPSEDEIRGVLTHASPGDSPRSSTAMEEMMARMSTMDGELRLAQQTILSLARTSSSVQDDNDVSGNYDVAEEVLGAIPGSFVTFDPLSKNDRRQILRAHLGCYPKDAWPKSLSLKDATKLSADLKKAPKIELTELAKVVTTFMDRNAVATKMAGTAWSRGIDMRDSLADALDADPDVTFRGDETLSQLETIIETTAAAFRLNLDTSANMRYEVSKRVDVAMGIDHLRVDPHKRGTDDFLSEDTYKLVETAAKIKSNLAIAKKGVFPGTAGYFSHRPSPKPSGGGGNYKKRGKGSGGASYGGSSSAGGKGRGSGGKKGKGSKGKGGGRGKGDTSASGD